jgi:hypothetical protein
MLRFTIPVLSTAILLIFAALLFPAWLNPAQTPDAFAPFDMLAPGQPVDALRDYACSSVYGYEYYWNGGQSVCQINIPDGPIYCVTVIYQGDTISSIWFHTRGLHMADVAKRWGRPDNLYVGNLFYIARWESGVYATAITSGWFTLNSPVNFISVTHIPQTSIVEQPVSPAAVFANAA